MQSGLKDRELGYVPALDGLRAVAVGAVLLHHHDSTWLPGGYLGVSLFFTLSGFLIASLLMAEHRRAGSISLRSFWVRRVRRIIPVAWVGLGLGIAAAATIVSDVQRSMVVGDVRAAFVSLLNWRYVLADGTYAEQVLDPSPVVHYWSLAIEEQFYVFLPLLVVATRARRWLVGGCALLLIAVSFVQQLRLDEVNRLYYGTDVRMGELAAGVLLAAVLPSIRPWFSRARADAVGWISAALLLGSFAVVRFDGPGLLSGGLTLVAAISVGVIVGAISGPRFGAVLSTPGAVMIGRCSFALYVVHLPVFVLLSPERSQIHGLWLLLVRLVVTGVVAGLLHVLIEDPIRFRRLFPGRSAAGLWLATSTAVLLLATAMVPPSVGTEGFTVTAPPELTSDVDPFDSQPGSASDAQSPSASSTPAGPSGVAEPCGTAGCDEGAVPASGAPGADESNDKRGPEASAVPQPEPINLVVIGDSTAGVNGRAMASVGAELGIAAVTVANAPACAVLPGDRLLVRSGFWFDTPCRGDFADRVRPVVEQADADAVVVFLGSAQVGLWDYGGPDAEGLDSPVVLQRYVRSLRRTLAGLDGLGIPVLWADVPLPAWDLKAFGEETKTVPNGSGPVTLNDEKRWRLLDSADDAALATSDNVVRWEFVESLEGPSGQVDYDLFFDGLHLHDDAAAQLARDAWLPSIVSAYAAHPLARPNTIWNAVDAP